MAEGKLGRKRGAPTISILEVDHGWRISQPRPLVGNPAAAEVRRKSMETFPFASQDYSVEADIRL